MTKGFNHPPDNPLATLERLLDDEQCVQTGLSGMQETLIQSGNFRFLESPAEDIYAFATPLLLTEAQYEAVTYWSERIVTALENAGRDLRSNPEEARRTLLFHSPLDEAFFFFDPEYHRLLPINRLDLIVCPKGPPQLLEVNCGCPGGELDPALVANAFFQSSLGREFVHRLAGDDKSKQNNICFQDPRDDSLITSLKCYQVFRQGHPDLPESPTIALVTTPTQAHFMIPESRGIVEYYEGRGHRTLIGDILELETDGKRVLLRGEPVHLIFRKFSTPSFRVRMEDRERFGDTVCRRVRDIWEAIANGLVCLVNPLGSTALQDKGLMAYLRESFPELHCVIPETHILASDLPIDDPALWNEIQNGEAFILKRRLSFAGRHVILDPLEVRRKAGEILREAPNRWVAQRRVSIPSFPFAIWDNQRTTMGHFKYCLSPFVRSFFVRLGAGGKYQPLSAHSGGATTFALIIKG